MSSIVIMKILSHENKKEEVRMALTRDNQKTSNQGNKTYSIGPM